MMRMAHIDQDKNIKLYILITNILINKTMKKLFFFAAAAIGMLAGCQKQNEEHSVNENTPVAMQLGATTATYTVTKAAVNEWDAVDGTTVFVYGLKNTETGYAELFGNYETKVKDAATALEIYEDKTVGAERPYFYEEGLTYDFFGYYKGGADLTVGSLTNNEVSHTVTFDGSHDLMYAHTDKTADIVKAAATNAKANDVTFADVYSAWAARRDVQPNLIFKHALTKFNFIVEGKNDASESVTVTEVSVKSVNTGSLKVVGDVNTLGFTAAAVAETDLYLKNADDTDLSELDVKNGVKQLVGAIQDDPGTPEDEKDENASLMVAPEMPELKVVVKMVNNEYGDNPLPNYEFTVAAKDVVRNDGETMTAFKAGEAYNITINVYGPEEIKVTATLTDWNDAGEYTYDPDDEKRPGTTEKTEVLDVAASVAVISDMSNYYLFYPSGSATAPSWDEAYNSGTLPWVGFKVEKLDVDQVLYVKCKYNGNYVAFKPAKTTPWYENVGPFLIKLVVPAGKNIVSFEVKDELGIETYTDGDTFEFEVERVVNE